MVIQLESRIEEAGCLVKPLGLWEIIFFKSKYSWVQLSNI